jgi:hypothetical protein
VITRCVEQLNGKDQADRVRTKLLSDRGRRSVQCGAEMAIL